MYIKFKDNVVFKIYPNKQQLKEKILNFIFEAKTDKILYKGNPRDINYKLLKKILPIEEIKKDKNNNSINKFVDMENKNNIREIYYDFLKNIKNPEHCLIHKTFKYEK